MELDKKALSDLTVFNKYAKFIHDKGRRENYGEIVDRNKEMHQRKYPQISDEIEDIYNVFVHTKRVLPSMRSLQFGGRPIELAHNRIFNCAYAPAEDYHFFSELMFLLLGGTGMGYSVQKRHVSKLPMVKEPESRELYKYQIQDSIVGWSDAVKVVAKAYLHGKPLPNFDYRDIREKGSELVTTGGLAPGPVTLELCLKALTEVFDTAIGRNLSSLEVHDLACIIADAVLAGGIRRAAMICGFDRDDEELITSKARNPVTDLVVLSTLEDGTRNISYSNGYSTRQASISEYDFNLWESDGKLPWYIANPYRGRANNSAVLIRGEVTEQEFSDLMKRVEESGCGEPGVYWTNNPDWFTNPCCEIALEPYQCCNLSEINASTIKDQHDLNMTAAAAAFIGTLQAGYTDFHYLNPKWKETCERGALLGVSMTGIASNVVTKLNMEEAANHVKLCNEAVAKTIGIRPSERTTCVKPAGTTSLVLGCSSGIHAWHNDYYIRRMRAGKDEKLAQYMQKVAPQLVEQDVMVPHQVVLSFPQKAPDGACMRTEDMFDLLERVKQVSKEWVHTGHNKGNNKHNVSCTISVKSDEWLGLTKWMWDNKSYYNGISVLPYYGAEAYPQLPFEDCSKEVYESLLPYLMAINIDEVFEEDGTKVNLVGEIACSGNACEVTF